MMRVWFERFRSDRRANVLPTFALSLIPVMGFVGTAVDYSHGNAAKAAMQAAADATALALVKEAPTLTSFQLTQQANDRFKALFSRPEVYSLQISAAFNTEKNYLTVSTVGSLKTDFMGVVGVSVVSLSASAVATYVTGATGCVLALSKTASGAITAQGSTVVTVNGCSIYDNSNSPTALTVGGSAKVSALSVGVVGGISGNMSVTTTQGIYSGVSPIADPYAKVAVPFFSGCNEKKFTTKETVTINPGVYCGGIQLHAGANVTMNPGIYYMDQGSLSVNGGATLTGKGVTIIFTSSTMSDWATAAINGGATVNLTPPTTGPTAGIVLFGDRNIPVGTSFKFNGGASQYLGGAIYLPTGAVDFAGGIGSGQNCTKLIGDTIAFSGNSNLAIDCSGYATKSFGPAGSRLVS